MNNQQTKLFLFYGNLNILRVTVMGVSEFEAVDVEFSTD